MEESEEPRAARAMRRAVLGDAYIEAMAADPNPGGAEFQDYLTAMAWGVWARGRALSVRDRSLLVMAMTAALGRMEEFRLHASSTSRTGVTDDEVDERLFQIAAYCGAPAGSPRAAPSRRSGRRGNPKRDSPDRRVRRARPDGQRSGLEPRADRLCGRCARPARPAARSSRRHARTGRIGSRSAGRRGGVECPRWRRLREGRPRDPRGRRLPHHARGRHLDDRRARRARHRRAARRAPRRLRRRSGVGWLGRSARPICRSTCRSRCRPPLPSVRGT